MIKRNVFRMVELMVVSPVLTTWIALSARAMSILLIMPFLMSRYCAEDVAFYYEIIAYILFSGYFSISFSSIFVQFYANAEKGSTLNELEGLNDEAFNRGKNHKLINELDRLMENVYLVIALFVPLLLAVVYHSFGSGGNSLGQKHLWTNFAFILCGLSIYLLKYSNSLSGEGNILWVKRIDLISGILGIFLNVVLIIAKSSIVVFVFVPVLQQCLSGFLMLLMHKKSRKALRSSIKDKNTNGKLLMILFRKTWRVLVGVLSYEAINLLTVVFITQFKNPKDVAQLLVTIRLVDYAKRFSQSVMLVRVPRFCMLRSEGKISSFVEVAKRTLRIAYGVSFLLSVILYILKSIFEEYLNLKVDFVTGRLFYLMFIASFVDRYVANHKILYQTTNNIVSHKIYPIVLLIYGLVLFSTHRCIGDYSLPVSLILSNVMVGIWLVRKSNNSMKTNSISFERSTFLPFALGYISIFLIILL